MKKFFTVVVIFIFALVLGVSAQARGTQKEAKAMVKKASAFYKTHGKENTLKELSNSKGQFIKGDLYVFAYALSDGTTIAHPINHTIIGKNLTNVPDQSGKYFRKEIWEQAKAKGSGWVDYQYLNPETKKIEYKTTYFLKVGDLILGCGAYK